MKKSLIALAVAGALTAPMIAQADATIYGSLRTKIVMSDDDNAGLDVTDNTSRIGLKGSQETGMDGVTATYQAEYGSSTDTGLLTARLANVGLKTNAGNVVVGRQWTPAFLVVGSMVDILDGGASNPTHMYGTEGRQSNMVAYTTPKMGGFQASLGLIANNDQAAAVKAKAAKFDGAEQTTLAVKAEAAEKDDSDGLNAYNLAASYEMEGVRLALSHTDYDAAVDMAKTAVAASYSMDALYVAGVYSSADVGMRNADTGKTSYELVASYDVSDQVKLLAQYVDFGKSNGVDEGTQHELEAWYKLGKKARTFVNYTGVDSDREVNDKFGSFSVGYRVDF